jgi:predicted peptidase
MFKLLIGLVLVLAACGAPAPAPSGSQPTQAPDDLIPGIVDVRSATMSDGTEIAYGLILPEDFDPALEYPVLFALPPGSQSIDLAVSIAESTYLAEALVRGWVVITPAAPGGTLFFQGSEQYVGELLDSLAWIRLEGGRYHLSGISNGGRSAFAVAELESDRFASMVVFPGYPSSPDDRAALEGLEDIPISMFVGGDDPGWIEPMVTTEETLRALGATVSLEIREGEGHIMSSLSDGVDVFDFLDSVR